MRMKTIRAFLFILLLFPGLLPGADQIPGRFVRVMQRALDADAAWTMTKRMSRPALTLTSSGKVSCFAGRGIIWMSLHPFAQQIRMTRDAMTFVSELDTVTKPLAELPHYGEVRRAVDAFLAGEAGPFSTLFAWSWKSAEKGWVMTLEPKHPGMARLVQRARLEGDTTLERVRLVYASGDRVDLTFKESGRALHGLWK